MEARAILERLSVLDGGGGQRVIDFLKQAFGATELCRFERPADGMTLPSIVCS